MALEGLERTVLPALLGVLQIQRWGEVDKIHALFVEVLAAAVATARQAGTGDLLITLRVQHG